MTDAMPFGRDLDARVVEAMDRFLAALERGETPDREAFLRDYPGLEDELRPCLDALAFVQTATTEQGREPEELQGKSLGDFQLRREIARGGMGVVYEAEQLSLGRRVALKVLPFAAVLDDRQLQRFRFEAQAAALLHHTNIVPVFAVGQERGVHYYAMQYIDGRSLQGVVEEVRRLESGRSDSRSESLAAITPSSSSRSEAYCEGIARLGIQAAEALDYAHRQGLVHCDVKPANLMVDATGHLWITDFGLARSSKDMGLTMTGDLVGTLRYMSPEQTLAKGAPVDHRSDVYSLGATLYETLTLQPTFPGRDPHQVLRDIATLDPAPPRRINPAVPAELQTILLKALEKDPQARYATAGELAADLRRYLEHKPLHARPPTVIDRLAKWARRHRTLVTGGAAVLLLAVVGLAMALLAISREQARTSSEFQRAEKNYQLARDAVERMLTRLGASDLSSAPGLQPLRKELLEDALEFYEAFARQRPDEPEARVAVALARGRVGDLHLLLGEAELAVESFREARDALREHGSAQQRASVSYRLGQALFALRKFKEARPYFEEALAFNEGAATRPEDTASALSALAVCDFENGDHVEGELKVRRAIALQKEVCERADAVEPAFRKLAVMYRTLGKAVSDTGRLDDALPQYHAALKALEERKAAATDWREHREIEAGCRNALGTLHHTAAQVEDAVREYKLAIEAWEELAERYPAVPHYRVFASQACTNLGMILADTGRAGESLPWHRRALENLDAAAAASPDPTSVKAPRAWSSSHYGVALEKVGEVDEATAVLRRAAASQSELVLERPDVSQFRDHLAQTLYYLGDRALDLGADSSVGRALSTTCGRNDFAFGFEAAAALWAVLSRELRDITDHQEFHGFAAYDTGNTYLERGKLAEAEAAFREAEKTLEPLLDHRPQTRESFARVQSGLGWVRHRMHQPEQATERLDRAIRLAREVHAEVDTAASRKLLAECLSRQGEVYAGQRLYALAADAYVEAANLYDELAEADPLAQGTREKLVSTLDRCATSLWDADRRVESLSEARRELAACIRLVDDFPEQRQYLGWLAIAFRRLAGQLGASEMIQEASEVYDRAIARFESLDLAPARFDTAKFHVNYSDLLGRARQRKEAARHAEAAEKILAELGTGDSVRDLRSIALINLGLSVDEPARAADAFAEAERLLRALGAKRQPHPNLNLVCERLAPALTDAGRYADAIAACERWVDDDPKHVQARRRLAWILAAAPEPHRDPDRALEIAERVLAEDGDNSASWRVLGVARYRAGDTGGAIEALEKARATGNAEAGLFVLACARARQGNAEKAKGTLKVALEWQESHPGDRIASELRAEAERVLAVR